MRRPLGLALYLALTARRRIGGAAPALPDPQARPKGPLVWLQVPQGDTLPAAVELARRIVEERPAAHVLVTAAEFPAPPPRRILHAPLPVSDPAEMAAFLARWQPDAAAQIGGAIDPVMLCAAATAGLPPLLVQPQLPAPRPLRWIPWLSRTVLGHVARILVPEETAARTLRRMSGGAAQVQVVGRLGEGSVALPCNEAEREAMAQTLHTRPIWLAVQVPEAELPLVAEAHRAALRLAHRLLLILVPEDPARGAAIAAHLAASEGWTVAQRNGESDLEPETEVYVADTEGELGLWYRLAPITYLGGSLLGPGCLRPPFEPAALGSAVIHGPQAGPHGAALASLSEARAVREVRSAAELGDAVGDLLSPDRAALLAHNAWAVTSNGADVTDAVAGMLLQAVDARKAAP